jgi:hypothetical protein
MTYDEFLMLPANFINDMTQLMTIKTKHNLHITREEKIYFEYIKRYFNEMKMNTQKSHLEKCWRVKNETNRK